MAALYRAEVVGSLLRPDYLAKAREQLMAGSMAPAELKRIEDRAVDEAVALQQAAGVDVVTDGEMRRFVFADHLFVHLHGLAPPPAPPLPMYDDEGRENPFQPPFSVAEPIRRKRMITPEEFVYARARADRPVKATVPSPMLMWGTWLPERSPEAYPDPFELFVDAAELVREEVLELAALGCEYIQIDAPDVVTMHADPTIRERIAALGLPVERMLGEGVELIDSIAADVPGVTFGIHMCRSNHRSSWMAEGGYEGVAEQVFPRLRNIDVYMLEYDDARSGSFEPLRSLPDDKVAVLGLVTTKRARVEERSEVVDRIREAGRFASHEQLALSTQCGFASEAGGNLLDAGAQEAKLRLVADVAHELWSLELAESTAEITCPRGLLRGLGCPS
ncbi:MAG: cobalamin-independent methionine synthase II family protein [Stackebrandtia sp.]